MSFTPLHHHHQPEPFIQGRMDPCFHVVYAKFWPYHLNVTAEMETCPTKQTFFSLLFNFGEPVWIVASISRVAPGVVFCCCSPSASRFDMMCVQRCTSAFLGCNEWLTWVTVAFLLVQPVWPFSYDLWHQQGILDHRTAAHWIFSLSNRYLVWASADCFDHAYISKCIE